MQKRNYNFVFFREEIITVLFLGKNYNFVYKVILLNN